jgi:two-component system cell cycle response regulator DivK
MNKKLLLIEDNEQNIYLIKFLLEKNGIHVDVAKSGGDGIKKALSIKPDMILLDIQLPDIDGYSIARELKKHNELSNIPIIAVTSYALSGDREKAIEAGCTGYLEKPINPDTFIDEIKKYFIDLKRDQI